MLLNTTEGSQSKEHLRSRSEVPLVAGLSFTYSPPSLHPAQMYQNRLPVNSFCLPSYSPLIRSSMVQATAFVSFYMRYWKNLQKLRLHSLGRTMLT